MSEQDTKLLPTSAREARAARVFPTNIPTQLVDIEPRQEQAQMQQLEQQPKPPTEQLSTGMLRRKSDPEPIDEKALEDALEYGGDILRQVENRVVIPEGMEGNPDFFISFAENLPLILQDMQELGDNNLVPAVKIAIRQATEKARSQAKLREAQNASSTSLDKFLEERKKRETEDMTGLTTRGGFDRIGLDLARNGDQIFVAALGDVNRLKAVNDLAGHSAGDRMIKQAAEAFKASVRDTDTPARYGGDEMALLLPDTNLEQARIIADRLMDELAKQIVPELGQGVNMGVGLVEIDPAVFIGLNTVEAVAKFEDMMKRAEAAMYEAKNDAKIPGNVPRGYMFANDPRAQERYKQMNTPPNASTIIDSDVR